MYNLTFPIQINKVFNKVPVYFQLSDIHILTVTGTFFFIAM